MKSLNYEFNDDVMRPIFIKYSTIYSNLLLIHYDVTCRLFLRNIEKGTIYSIAHACQSYSRTNK